MREKFARSIVLFIQYLRRDWKKIIGWLIGLALFSGAFVPAFEEIGKDQELLGMFEILQNPAMISMVGSTPITEAANYTIGAMYSQTMLLFCCLFSMIVSGLHVISHTRKEEELGLIELIRSFQVGRQANSLAVILETVVINLLLALMIAGTLVIFDAETINLSGAILFGLSIGGAGILGGSLALIHAQIMPNAASAIGSTLGTIGLLYILRAGTDVSDPQLSKWNPLGWNYYTNPFTENNGFYLYLIVIVSLILVFIAFALENYRDMGAGYLPEREGRSHAKKSLLSVPGLLLRINRGVMISWFLAFLILGAAYGSIYGDMQTFLEGNELMRQMFLQSGISIEASFTSTILKEVILLVVILPIVIINKLFFEERQLRFNQLYATKVSRGKVFGYTIGLSVLAGVVGILFSAGGLGVSALFVMEGETKLTLGSFLTAGLNYLPSLLFFIGVAAIFLGWFPKGHSFTYIYLAYSFALSFFGELLNLPEWLAKTAILNWIPAMPVEEFDPIVFLGIAFLGMMMILLGYLGYRNRDLLEGA